MSVVRKIAVSIGVVALLMATPVLAAKSKKAPKQPLPRPAPVFSWTGYYVGANAGGVCTNAVANRDTFGTTFGPLDPNGFVDFGHRIPLLGQFPRFLGGACRSPAATNLATTCNPQIGFGVSKETYRGRPSTLTTTVLSLR